jgi:hypothetical protein
LRQSSVESVTATPAGDDSQLPRSYHGTSSLLTLCSKKYLTFPDSPNGRIKKRKRIEDVGTVPRSRFELIVVTRNVLDS